MRSILLLFLCIFLSSNTFSQGWVSDFLPGYDPESRFVAEDPSNGSITIAVNYYDLFIEYTVSQTDGTILSFDTTFVSDDYVGTFEISADGNYLIADDILKKVEPFGTEIWAANIYNVFSISEDVSGNILAVRSSDKYNILDSNGVELVSDTLKNICTDCQSTRDRFYPFPTGGFGGLIETQSNTYKYVKIDALGNLIWETPLPSYNGISFYPSNGGYAVMLPDSSIIYATNTASKIRLAKIDFNGALLWEKTFDSQYYFYDCNLQVDIVLSNDGNILLHAEPSEQSDFPVADLWKFTADGDSIWQKSFGIYLEGYLPYKLFQATSGDIYQLGRKLTYNSPSYVNCYLSSQTDQPYLLKFNSEGEAFTNEVNGTVFLDETSNCLIDGNDQGLKNRLLRYYHVNHEGYAITDANGNYSFLAGEGDYEVELLDYSIYWTQSCQTTKSVSIQGSYQVETLDFAADAETGCAVLNVDLSTPFLRRCFDGSYAVSYCNEGPFLANNAYLEVSLDPNLNFSEASAPYTVTDNVYTFQLGDVDISECGEITLDFVVDCNVELGYTHCSEARIFPDTLCSFSGDPWDGSDLTILEDCQNDSLLFSILNKGQNMAAPREYRLYENLNLIEQDNFQLNTAGVLQISVAANGSVYRLEADEDPAILATQITSKTNISCNGDPVSLASMVNAFGIDETPFVSRDCRDNVGSYDPNDKAAFPLGCGDQHLISADEVIEYLIRFQNTGTDTAFTVVLKDELSENLDISTLRPGGSSHPYTWHFDSGRQLRFQFDNINLPTKSENEAASQGYITFHIKPLTNLADGFQISNKADIYFDFNAPITTNETTHTIGNCNIGCTGNNCPVGIFRPRPLAAQLQVYPNPVTDQLTIQLQDVKAPLQLKIHDTLGRVIWTGKAETSGTLQVKMKDCPKGIYLLSAFDDERQSTLKIVR